MTRVHEWIRLAIFISQTFFFATLQAAGVDVGNGGDLLDCQEHPRLKGLYTLDFLLYETNVELGGPLRQVADLDASFTDLEEILQSFPKLRQSFKQFREDLFNQDPQRHRLWIPSSTQLLDIPTEQIRFLPPEGCYKIEDGKIKYLQAVRREVTPRAVTYYFDAALVEKLRRDPTKTLQLSMLIVHEWLWDVMANNDTEKLRLVNRYLHGDHTLTMAAESLRSVLLNLGVAEDFLPTYQQSLDRHHQLLQAGTGFLCANTHDHQLCWGSHAPQLDEHFRPGKPLAVGYTWVCTTGDEGGIHCRNGAHEALPGWMKDERFSRQWDAVYGGGQSLCVREDLRMFCRLAGANDQEFRLPPKVTTIRVHSSIVCLATSDKLHCPGYFSWDIKGPLQYLDVTNNRVCWLDDSGAHCRDPRQEKWVSWLE